MSESMDSETFERSIYNYDNSNDSDFLPPIQPKASRKRKSTAGTRKVLYAWTDKDIVRLISSVEQRRGLWDGNSAEYKLSKKDGWRSVSNELNIVGVDSYEARTKWLSLRTTFMTNLAKLRKRKSGRGPSQPYTVNWRFFQQMTFLKANNEEQLTSSTSTLQLPSAVTDRAIAEQFSGTSQPSRSRIAVSNRRRRQFSQTLSSPPSPSPSTPNAPSCTAMTMLNSAVAALHSADPNSTLCAHLLAELQALSEDNARALRFKLLRTMNDYLEICQAEPPTVSPVQIVDEQGRPIEVNDSFGDVKLKIETD